MNDFIRDDGGPVGDVRFYSPISSRLFNWFATLIILVMGGMLTMIVCMVGLPLLLGYQNPPAWWLPFGGAATLIIILLLIRYANRAAPSRLILREDDLRIGGILFKRRIRYDDVEIIHVPTEGSGSRKSMVELRIQPRRGYRAAIWLKRSDAPIVVSALRDFCDSAAALEGDENISLPADPQRADTARRAVARDYRNRATLALAVAILAGAYTVFAMVALAFGTNASTFWRALPQVVIGPMGVIGSMIAFFRYRAMARHIEAECGVDCEINDPDVWRDEE